MEIEGMVYVLHVQQNHNIIIRGEHTENCLLKMVGQVRKLIHNNIITKYMNIAADSIIFICFFLHYIFCFHHLLPSILFHCSSLEIQYTIFKKKYSLPPFHWETVHIPSLSSSLYTLTLKPHTSYPHTKSYSLN